LLPLIGGLIAGAKAADRLLAVSGAKFTAAAGFGVMTAGLLIGTATMTGSSYSFIAMWMTLTGIGLGLTLPTAMASALNQLSVERSGVGSALIMTIRQVGGAIGVALLGSALNSGYRGGLDVEGVPETAAEAVKQSVSAGVAAARQMNSSELMDNVRHAFVNGMDSLLWVCGGIAFLGICLTWIFLPRQSVQSTDDIHI